VGDILDGDMTPKDESHEAEEGTAAPVRASSGADDLRVASDRDERGQPVHRGWTPAGGRRRWLEPFVLVLLASGSEHGYAIMGDLEALGVTNGAVDVGQVYRTLRDLEAAGQVTSEWSNDPVGPQRREYQLTDAGHAALAEWAAVMKDRARLIKLFEKRLGGRAGTGAGSAGRR
jgi:PadR family transcriptional regulator PadR